VVTITIDVVCYVPGSVPINEVLSNQSMNMHTSPVDSHLEIGCCTTFTAAIEMVCAAADLSERSTLDG